MKHLSLILAMILTGSAASASGDGHRDSLLIPPSEARERLMEGNARFAAWKASHPRQNQARLIEVARDQRPFAAVVTCSDSRVAPEILFDQGLGDLFVVRLAGNVVTNEALGSLEYAAEHLGVSLIFVLGHEKCGAVDAALAPGSLPGHMESLAREIRPALRKLNCPADDKLACSVKGHVAHAVGEVAGSRPISKRIKSGRLAVVGGYYTLGSGRVSLE